jgi:predicted thioesterase
MKPVKPGIKGTAETIVTFDDLALTVGSGSLDVFATPSMVALMEKAACDCLEEYLTADETTVGTELNIKHLSATPESMTVRAEAELREINGREFIFDVKAYDEAGLIGEGTHKRFMVNGPAFADKTKAKLR